MKQNLPLSTSYLFILSISYALIFFSCTSKQAEQDEEKFECIYKEYENFNSTETNKNGHKVSGNLRGAIKANTKLLKAEGELEAQLTDTSYLNFVQKKINKNANYSQQFLETHNSIIQILCAIEKDLKDTLLSEKQREILMNDKIQKRDEYFNFLLDKKSLVKKTKEKTKKRKAEPLLVNEPTNALPQPEEYFEAIGFCVIDTVKFNNKAQAIAMAKKGALIVGKAELLEQIKGTEIKSETTISDLITQNSTIQSKVEGIIKGAHQVGDFVIQDGMVEVKVRTSKKDILNVFSNK